MIKEIIKLMVAFGIMGGIVVAPNMLQQEVRVNEPNLDLPTVGTYEKLKELVNKADENNNYYYMDRMTFGSSMMKNAMPDAVATNDMAVAESASSKLNTDYSKTNVQVEGVDEADIMKTDGEYIYHLVNEDLKISKIYPADSMKLVSTIDFEKGFSPRELYVEGDMVIVIGDKYQDNYREYYSYWSETFTQIIIYDAKDKANVKVAKKVDVSGYYNSSRRIGNALYLVAQKNINRYWLDEESDYEPLPLYKDSRISEDYKKVTCDCIRYFPDFKCSQYMITVGVDLSNLDKEAQISTYLGNSESIYSSLDNMYVTFSSYKKPDAEVNGEEVALKRILDSSALNTVTSIYRFKLENGEMNCKATGEVKGSILNQFSMDESNGYFRIATTVGSITGTGDNISKNNMYVLDMDLKTVGSIEDIAPGEKIYSVRFMGNRAYMVTFRKVDPLFVIDLSKPEEPTILGKLKIPGYSDYLHPYDENHIIGFGKDAALVSNEEGSWGWADDDGVAAYYQGMKIAIFDVTDPENPIEMWKEEIGDRGTESELLNNHKALLFSKDKNLLAFPIRVATVNEKDRTAWTYGDTTFVGAYVYEITLDKGFVLKAKLTNLTDEDWKKLGYYYYGDKTIDRLIYINDVLYTIAESGYSAYKLSDFTKIGTLKIN
jgi:uncharacterized secreted protein with C-terminal beta-propeller domain